MGIEKNPAGGYSWAPKGAPPGVGSRPGWYDDPDSPGLQRYWAGSEWHREMPPRAKPEPALKQARIIAVGILIAAAVVFVVWRSQQLSDLECLDQAREVVRGERFAVEDACR